MRTPDDHDACPECDCLPGDFAPGGMGVRLLRFCECDCHTDEERAGMRRFGARQGGPLPPEDPFR